MFIWIKCAICTFTVLALDIKLLQKLCWDMEVWCGCYFMMVGSPHSLVMSSIEFLTSRTLTLEYTLCCIAGAYVLFVNWPILWKYKSFLIICFYVFYSPYQWTVMSRRSVCMFWKCYFPVVDYLVYNDLPVMCQVCGINYFV